MKTNIVIVILLLFVIAAHAEGQEQLGKDFGTKKQGNLKLEYALDKMVSTMPIDFFVKYNIYGSNLVQVIIDLKQSDPQYIAALENAGAIIEVSDKNHVQAHVPVPKLNAIADLPFVNYIRQPEKYMPLATSEGVNAINATALHGLGYNGSGVKIAVLDLGFAGYQSKLGTELPQNVVVGSFRADGDITGGGEVHGTAVAETVHDVAPGAQLYLVNYATDLEMNRAVNWLIGQNVDIISHSAGKSIGPKDGTDYADSIVNNATANGILWVNAAGNGAEEHWMGNFSDPDIDTFHNFVDNDETQDIFAVAGQQIIVYLDWDDWPYSSQDYDLYLLDDSLGLLASSENLQTGIQPPVETISYIATYTGSYKIAIKKYSAIRNVKFHLYTPDTNTQYNVPAGSIAIPGTSSGSFTVGATHWLNDILEPYSSQGPTDDGRIKPDISAPSNTTNSVYGIFRGTSASAPHASGAAALLLQINSSLSVNQLKHAIESGAKDLGVPGKDNQFGTGRIDIYRSAQQFLKPLTVNGTITGRVTNASSTLPIANATVIAGGMTAITNAAGAYNISIAPGTYLVNASAMGFIMANATVLVASADVVTQNFSLQPIAALVNGTVTGRVTNASSALPIANATVTAGGITAITNATGIYNMSIVPNKYTVNASAAGFLTQSATNVSVASEATIIRNFALQPVVSALPLVVAPFDTSGDGRIQRNEAVAAIVRFFSGDVAVPRTTAIAVIVSFFSAPAG